MPHTFTLALLFFVKLTLSARCDSFNRVKMTVHPEKGKSYQTEISGCIERAAFDHTIIEVRVKNQKIQNLGPDSVRNMVRLYFVQFENSGIATVEPGAFRNVPELKTIKIVDGELEEVPTGVFNVIPKLEFLKLRNNKLREIENGGFGGLPKLKKLYCDHNFLEKWDPAWFTNSTNLEIMDFQANKIKILPRRAFQKLSKLKEVYFDYNELESIQAEGFKGLTNLDYLGLRYNRLKFIDFRVFPSRINITTLTIDANYLNFLPKKLMETVKVQKIAVYGNPWKCPCLDQVLLWLHDNNSTAKKEDKCTGRDLPVCSFSSEFSKICEETVDEEVTKTYLEELRRSEPPLDRYCARLN